MNEDTRLEEYRQFLINDGKSPRTVDNYLYDMRVFAVWFEQSNDENLTPQTITPTDVRLYRQHLVAVQKRAPSTINRKLAVIRSYVGWAKMKGEIDLDPTIGVKGVSEQTIAPRWLDRKEKFALIREIERDLLAARSEPARRQAIHNKAIVVTLLNTGLRIGRSVP